MKNFKKILIFITLLSIIGCSKNMYVRTIEYGYKKSDNDKTLYIKEDENATYTKKKIRYQVYDDQHFLVLKVDKKTNEKTLYLVLKYRGSKWIYMNGIDLISNTVFHIDFMARKMNSALWKEKANFVDSVEEYIAFTLKPEEIEGIRKMVQTGHGEIKYYSELGDLTTENTEITSEEIQNMNDILNLY